MSTFTIQVNCAVPPNRTVDLYSSWGDISNYNYNMYYQIDNGSYIYWGIVLSMACGNLNTIYVPDGSTLSVIATNASNNIGVYINGAISGTCPANSASILTYSNVITANASVYITIYVDSFGDPAYGV